MKKINLLRILIPGFLLLSFIFIQAQAPGRVAVNLLYDLGYLSMELPVDMNKVVRWKAYGDSACADMMYYRFQSSASPTILDAVLMPPDSGMELRQITIRHKLHHDCFSQRSFLNARSILKVWKKDSRGKVQIQDSIQVGRHKFVLMAYETKFGDGKIRVFRSAAFIKSQWLEFECVSTREKDPDFIRQMRAAFKSIRFK